MKKTLYIAVLFIAGNSFISTAQLDLKKGIEKTAIARPKSGLSEDEVGKALKEALNLGIDKGVSQLSKPDGYFKDTQIKILMPDEAKNAETKLRAIGQGQKVDDAIESMNRAAEDAATSAKQLFVDAIKAMTMTDVMNILNGTDDAATKYLSNATRAQLVEKFKPIIKASLDKTGATKHWASVFTAYNAIPMVQKVNPDLVDFVTNKAIDGLFVQIAKEELSIRKNPAARVSDLLKKVFG